ncbi:MAG: 50S ribosomal protein L24 [Lachnospiraceae bacterium]|nr:50S ribosomal protein L24 [Lachnospiraceae bacterium]
MSAIRIKVGDTVKVIAGKDKDKEGKVVAINKEANTAVVEGVNLVSKHTKPSMANQQGGIIEQEAPIDISNIMYVNKGQTTKIGYKVVDGKKVRIAKKTGEVID